MDRYHGGAGWSIATRPRPSTHIETRRVDARNMAQQFAAIYGSELSGERWLAIEEMRNLHVGPPQKYAFHLFVTPGEPSTTGGAMTYVNSPPPCVFTPVLSATPSTSSGRLV